MNCSDNLGMGGQVGILPDHGLSLTAQVRGSEEMILLMT